MKISVRLIISLTAVVTLVVTAFTFYQARQEKRLLVEDLERQSWVLSTTMQESLIPLLSENNNHKLIELVNQFGHRENLIGIALYDNNGTPIVTSQAISAALPHSPSRVSEILGMGHIQSRLVDSPAGHTLHEYYFPIKSSQGPPALLVLVHNADHILTRQKDIWRAGFFRWLIQSLLIALTTLIIIRWNVMAPLYRAADWIKELRLGINDNPSPPLPKDIFGPLAQEVNHIASSLTSARAAAEEEARLRSKAESLWTPERLREHVRTKLQSRVLFVVSNREPYMHVRRGKEIDCSVPASGLVTALEPVLRACEGTWIAHGSGDADRDMVDENDRLRVPPAEPQYTLRRVWLSKEEEDGYYYGFSNEGLWPLCHIAHARPIFIPEDWTYYQSVNQKFADAVLQEMEGVEEPMVLVQDYHFALLPRLIKEKRPDARVALFWHIPWPNPESFGICPWGRDLLQGMLGADLLGFHIQFHCNNFLDTVDRVLESRIDWERFAVNRKGHTTWVKPFPISVDFAQKTFSAASADQPPAYSKESLMKDLGVKTEFVGVGVDRIDYTKGILERFRGIERFLEKYKEYVGRFTFVELGAPSRTLIKRYHDLIAEVEAEAERINWRFQTKEWKPIVFLKKQHSHKDIEPFYKTADLCLVTSLHDGMNLVAKEYIANRDDNSGVLILSRFTGASRELRDAVIVNPYDIDQLAEALRFALEMNPEEREIRMNHMREIVRDNNIYRWGANLITELSNIRIQQIPKTTV